MDEVRVLCLYTGGTIGMLHSPAEGYVPVKGFLSKNLRSQARFHDPLQDSIFAHSRSAQAFSDWSQANKGATSRSTTPDDPEGISLMVQTSSGPVLLPSLVTPKPSSAGKHVRYAILEYDPLIDSSEVELTTWITIAADIERNYTLFDGFVVLHGTDTMAYSASALSFLLENLGKSVIFTGAQIPLSSLLNDSIENLLFSLIIAGHYLIPEVCLFFNHSLFRGNRAVKVSSDDFEAFSTHSFPPLATVAITIDVLWPEVLRPGLRPFQSHLKMSSEVGVSRVYPGVSAQSVRAMLATVKGLVLETFGAGNSPRRPELLAAFREASERGVVIVNVSQCANGAVQQNLYLPGRELERCGIVSGVDMTTECALAKLAYLLSKPELTPAQVRVLVGRPLRGELTLESPVAQYSPPPDGEPTDRLRSLFAQVTQGIDYSPTQRPSSTNATLPSEFEPNWPATQADTLAIERKLLPFLLGQGAAKQGSCLATLIESLDPTYAAKEDEVALPALTILNDPTSPSLHTPLHIAVIYSRADNVSLLLSRGASVHSRDIFSHSVLFYAGRLGPAGKEIVQLLRGAGAHLGELEIENGDVGREILRAEKLSAVQAIEVWRVVTVTEETYERAKKCFLEWLA